MSVSIWELLNEYQGKGKGDFDVKARVNGALKTLIPNGIQVDGAKGIVLGFAIEELYKAPSTATINWIGVVAFAADVCGLFHGGFLKSST